MKKTPYVYLWLIYAFLYAPIVVVIVYSFNKARLSKDWRGFTWQWYESLFSNQPLIDSALNSLFLALCVACLATFLGTLAALCIHRYHFTGKRALQGSIYLLTISPDIVMGISLLILFVSVNIPLGFVSLLLGHVTMAMPFVTVTVLARLDSFDENLIEAARDLGASEAKSFLHVLLPLTMPGIAAGWLLSFTLSMDDVILSVFLCGPGFEVLPLEMYSLVLRSQPSINALSTIMFLMTLLLILLAQFLAHPRKKAKKP
ncbi:MAG: spermidine/putrescine ABC transporter permease PotC [Deltaproteobacteria bacterium]|jgi:spermidine/putrescine transport system permease protein|nr:spermidine/putrescine ABC transporter permease PotC [Deltaproteobacteria bacterium]